MIGDNPQSPIPAHAVHAQISAPAKKEEQSHHEGHPADRGLVGRGRALPHAGNGLHNDWK